MAAKKHVHGHDTPQVRIPKNFCFVCGKDNPDGMHLKFVYDEEHRRFFCRFRLPRRYQGPPGHTHGGIIATILDEAMGKMNRVRSVIALTSRMEVQYLRPVPLNEPLVAESREVSVRGRRHVNAAEIKNRRGEVLARGRGVFIAIDPHRMFAKHLRDGIFFGIRLPLAAGDENASARGRIPSASKGANRRPPKRHRVAAKHVK